MMSAILNHKVLNEKYPQVFPTLLKPVYLPFAGTKKSET
jgi:hypothetical protein